MTDIDPEKLMELRNLWIASCQAELDATASLVKTQTDMQDAQADFFAYASKGDAGLADLESDREHMKNIEAQIGKQRRLGVGQRSIWDEGAKMEGAVIGPKTDSYS